ncbi:MAG: hypothetical protein HY788_20645 [Deltaproteobacteria bacterium]|nr:hypothetical protein [Deltaproteobacteria bacterium]
MDIRTLLHGACDLHVHAAPDVVRRKQDAVDLGRAAASMGMAAVGLKDHTFSTAGRAHVLNRMFPQGPNFLGCMALNPPVGGLNPWAVESFLREGGKILYMPTYGARNHIRRWGAGKPPTNFPLPRGFEGISLLNASGNLVAECDPILEMVAQYDAVLATGHIAPEESMAVLIRARRLGVRRLLVTHASEEVTDMPMDLQKQAVDMGAMVEHCFFGVTDACPGDLSLEEIRDQILELGAKHVILTSDLGQVSNPAPVAGFGFYLEKLAAVGVPEQAIRRMIHDNPEKLVGPA